jgi:hypothetical protein
MVLLAFNFIAFWRMERWVSFWCFFGARPRYLIPGSAHLFAGSPDKIPVSGSYGNWLAKD